jgi:outer membrane lipoprotein-sorting protein
MREEEREMTMTTMKTRPGRRVRQRSSNATLLCAALSALLMAPAATAEDKDPDPAKLLESSVDDLYRGKSSVATVVMNVKTKRWKRTLKLKMWSKGTERSLIRILEPKKEKGVTTMKVGENVWNYLPKVDRVIKVPASMMSGSWMGSHLTNDDLVRESRYAEDFELKIVERPKDGKDRWVVEAVPKPDAPVVWGKVVVSVRAANRVPSTIEFFDERGNLVRTLSYDDVKEIAGKQIPMRMRVVPADKPDEYSEFIQQELSFDIDIPDEAFSQQALKR